MYKMVSGEQQGAPSSQRKDDPERPTINPSGKKEIITNANKDKCYYQQEKWPSRIMAFTTIAIMIITFLYMMAAREQVHQMITQHRIDQRPWVGVENISIAFEVDKPLLVTISIKNTGKTPAKNVTTVGALEWKTESHPNVPDFTIEKNVNKTFWAQIIPNQPIDLTQTYNDAKPLDIAMYNMIKESGPENIFVYGTIEYDDIFGHHHWTTYCFSFFKDMKKYIYHKEHNDTDNN